MSAVDCSARRYFRCPGRFLGHFERTCGRYIARAKLLDKLGSYTAHSGILRNISPLSPPSAASFVDIDKDIVLPLLQPVISSISLHDLSNAAQQSVMEEVLLFRPRAIHIHSSFIFRRPFPGSRTYHSKTPLNPTINPPLKSNSSVLSRD